VDRVGRDRLWALFVSLVVTGAAGAVLCLLLPLALALPTTVVAAFVSGYVAQAWLHDRERRDDR
jgi:hypothetical protein